MAEYLQCSKLPSSLVILKSKLNLKKKSNQNELTFMKYVIECDHVWTYMVGLSKSIL